MMVFEYLIKRESREVEYGKMNCRKGQNISCGFDVDLELCSIAHAQRTGSWSSPERISQLFVQTVSFEKPVTLCLALIGG